VVDKFSLIKRKERAIRTYTNEFVEDHRMKKAEKDKTADETNAKNREARMNFLRSENKRATTKDAAA